MAERRTSRIMALQALYYIDVDGAPAEALLDLFKHHLVDVVGEEFDPFFQDLVLGVTAHRHQLDQLLNAYATNWRVGRMAVVDRNVLRIALHEFLRCPDIPSTVSINEAVDIGKQFGTRASGPFINGVLDRIRMAENID